MLSGYLNHNALFARYDCYTVMDQPWVDLEAEMEIKFLVHLSFQKTNFHWPQNGYLILLILFGPNKVQIGILLGNSYFLSCFWVVFVAVSDHNSQSLFRSNASQARCFYQENIKNQQIVDVALVWRIQTGHSELLPSHIYFYCKVYFSPSNILVQIMFTKTSDKNPFLFWL